VAPDRAEAFDDWLSGQMLKRRGSINQASVEKDPARGGVNDRQVCERHLYRTPGKSGRIHPRQSSAAVLQFLSNDPPPRFVDRGKAALPKLCQPRRLPPAGTA